jgi:kynurenine formamidase
MEPFKSVGAALSNWGRWGDDDRLGTLNLISGDDVVRAAASVRRGTVFDLGLPIGPDGPPQRQGSPRFEPVHLMLRTPGEPWPGGMIGADDMVVLPLQASTQWDGLGHNGYDGHFYNAVPAATVSSAGSTQHSVHLLAQKGVVARGVLLDLAGLAGVDELPRGHTITAGDLDLACARQQVEVGSGDVLLVRTGWIRHWTVHRDAETFWSGQPGLGIDTAAWLYSRDVSAVLADNTGVEAIPTDPTLGSEWPLHCVLIRDLGMTLGEMANLEELAVDCRADGRWEFLFVATPLKVQGAVGAPITPLAVK